MQHASTPTGTGTATFAQAPAPTQAPRSGSLRGRLNGDSLLSDLVEMSNWLVLGYMPVYEKPRYDFTPRPFGAEALTPLTAPGAVSSVAAIISWVELDPGGLARLRLAMEHKQRLLHKVLPDLKAVEITDHTDSSKRFTDIELASRFYYLQKALGASAPTDAAARPN